MLSNDPADLAKNVFRDLANKGGGKIVVVPVNQEASAQKAIEDQGVPPVVKNGELYSQTDGAKRPGFMSLVINTIWSFWWMIMTKFWFLFPAMLGIIFLTATPESIEAILKEGITVGGSLIGAVWSFAWASVASLLAPGFIANRLGRGEQTSNGTIAILQIPAFYFSCAMFYNLAMALFLIVML